MATKKTVTIDTNTANGDADYHGIEEAIAGELTANADLVASDLQLDIVSSASTGVADVLGAVLDLTPFTVSDTCYLEIKAATGQQAGTIWNDNIYRMVLDVNDSATMFNIRTNQHFTGLQIKHGTSSTTNSTILGSAGVLAINYLDGCLIVKGSVGANMPICVNNNRFNGGFRLRNCIIVGATLGLRNYGNAAASRCVLNNCTFIDCATAMNMLRVADTLATNCIAQGCTVGFGSTGVTPVNCISDVEAEGAIDGVTYGTVTFAGAGNYALGPGDTVAKDAGADLSSNIYYPVTTDILGTARPQGAAYDVGAHELTSGGSALLPIMLSMNQFGGGLL